jgi:hypothetical protein
LASHHPGDRKNIASIAANKRWAFEPDRTAATAPARQAREAWFDDQVDPDRVLAPDERAKRVANFKQAYYRRLALLSAQARRKNGGPDAVA